MSKPKLTLKNIMVFDYVRRSGSSNVKQIFDKNKAEIEKLFGIKTYQSFNRHVAKVIEFERQNPLNNFLKGSK